MLARLRQLLLFIAVMMFLGALFLYGLLSLSFPQWEEKVHSRTIAKDVQVHRDNQGIPSSIDEAKGFLAGVAGKEVTEFLSLTQTRWDARLVDNWSGRASADDLGYRLV